jgi:hypothetical protein
VWHAAGRGRQAEASPQAFESRNRQTGKLIGCKPLQAVAVLWWLRVLRVTVKAADGSAHHRFEGRIVFS